MNTSIISSLSSMIRGHKNKKVFNTIMSFLQRDGRITQESLGEIKSLLKGDKQLLPLDELRRLAGILTLLKDCCDVDTVIPPIPIPPPRPSILPKTSREFSWVDGVRLLDGFFWEQWIGGNVSKNEEYEKLIFSFAFSLSTNALLQTRQISDILSRLQWGDIVNQGKSLKVRVHPDDRLNRYCIINLPTPSRMICHALYKFSKAGKPKQPFLFANSEIKPKRKKIKINNIINIRYQDLCDQFKKANSEILLPPTWRDFTQISYFFQFNKGMEPFIVSALQQYPLPVSHPFESPLNIYGARLPHHSSPFVLDPTKKIAPKHVVLKTIDLPDWKNKAITENDWCGESKTVLTQFVKKLKGVTKKKINTDLQIQKACYLISIAIDDADRLALGKKSALHLALCWIREFITEKKSISPSTAGKYFSMIFNTGFLMFGDSDDLSNWSVEDHELAIEASLSRENCSPSYKSDIIKLLKKVYKFAEKNGFSDHVDINFISDAWIGSSTRIEVIGLSRFDAFIKIMMEDGQHQSKMIAIASILAFYGGLRAGETTMLTLKNIVVLDGEVYIEICSGKTRAARRRIPLHLFAPEDMCNIIEQHWSERLAEFKKKGFSINQPVLDKIPFFGPERSRKAYTRNSLIDATIEALKMNFGDDIVYHSLRHSFASWLLIRWYAGRYPGFIDSLEEKHHKIFNKRCQAKFNSFFTTYVDRIPDYNASDLVKFSKVMGHCGHETLFSTYIHTFDAIQNHAMYRVSRIKGEIELNGKSISALVPKLKDRHNHTKLPGRTINDICQYLGLGMM